MDTRIMNKCIVLMPLSQYKKNLHRHVETFELANPKLFKDAVITENLCICSLKKNIADNYTWQDLVLESVDQGCVELYKWNIAHNRGIVMRYARDKPLTYFDKDLDFLETARCTKQTGGGFGKNGIGYKWNILHDCSSVNSHIGQITFTTAKARDNFAICWYSGDNNRKHLLGRATSGIKIQEVSAEYYFFIPQIDWEHISDKYPDYEKDPDYYVLKEMGLKWDDKREKIIKDIKHRADKSTVSVLMPISCYKKNELYRHVDTFELANPKLFADAVITENLCITTCKKNTIDKYSWMSLVLTSCDQKYIEYYKWNIENNKGLVMTQMSYKKPEDLDVYTDFWETCKCFSSLGGGGFGSNGGGYRWNMLYDNSAVNAGIGCIHFNTKIAKDNFCKWWYFGKKGEKLASKAALGIHMGGSVGPNTRIAIPQIDWGHISDKYPDYEKDPDYYVLKEMGLRWDDKREKIIKDIKHLADKGTASVLMPISCYKKNELYRHVEAFELANPKLFKDASVQDGLCITSLKKDKIDNFTMQPNNDNFSNSLLFKSLDQSLISFYIYNWRNNKGLAMNRMDSKSSKIPASLNIELDFVDSGRCVAKHKGAGYHPKTKFGYKYNVTKADITDDFPHCAGVIHFNTKQAKDNFCKYAYNWDSNKWNCLESLAMSGLRASSVSSDYFFWIPQIDWEHISDKYPDYEKDPDYYVLKEMGLKWDDKKEKIIKE